MPRTEAQIQATRARCQDAANVQAAEALRAAIEASGLSLRAYSRVVLKRPARSVTRWAWCKSPIPAAVREFLGLASMAQKDTSCGPEITTVR